ncbi:hypothetical protein BLNAU_12425 [Blattamonas nauphoetae]|uniref:Uncharacterized protein n=1 Tax=Blattamonas nauphoetae TaxID=2049346 RepID=A0ABQ9XJJ1_9EUKA|nr:hypothetical protein BLNAU_12425 [Blattamonas nauphoetae]
MLGVDERCVRISQNNRDLATEWQSNCIFSMTLVIARNVNRLVKLGRFETLGSLKKKAAEIEHTDVPTTYKVESIVLSDDVELDQLTNGTTLALLTDISPLVIEVTLRTNNKSTAIEMNRFEKMESLLTHAAALCGKGKDEVTMCWTDADVMGGDFGMGVVVVCGEGKKEFWRVSCRTSGLEMQKMVGDWLEVDWHRIRLWKDEQNEERKTSETGQTKKKKKKKDETAEGSSRTKRSKLTKQFMSEAERVRNMTHTLNLTLHCRIAPASIRIIARTETTKHTFDVDSWERIGTVRTKIARMLSVEVRVDGEVEEHWMSASATLHSLSRRVTMSNRHLSASSLTFTNNDTPFALSTRLISRAPEQPHTRPVAPSRLSIAPHIRIPTTLCGFRMDVDTITIESKISSKKF